MSRSGELGEGAGSSEACGMGGPGKNSKSFRVLISCRLHPYLWFQISPPSPSFIPDASDKKYIDAIFVKLIENQSLLEVSSNFFLKISFYDYFCNNPVIRFAIFLKSLVFEL
ncbi:unnamed protein product, partial [Vitis vinifera]|uniref:Uncharacterized protein n=1 Tax=Vitis vinifera TaxID=29760 RepID=D7UAQ8_VITVI